MCCITIISLKIMSQVKSVVVLMHQHAQECQNMPKGEVKQNWVGQSRKVVG